MHTRTEHDLPGIREVPVDAYYGIPTLHACENFAISGPPVSTDPGLRQFNAFEPIIAHGQLKTSACHRMLADKCALGITANVEHLRKNVENSIGMVTARNPCIGDENATAMAREVPASGRDVAERVLARGLLTADQLAEILRPKVLTGPSRTYSAQPR